MISLAAEEARVAVAFTALANHAPDQSKIRNTTLSTCLGLLVATKPPPYWQHNSCSNEPANPASSISGNALQIPGDGLTERNADTLFHVADKKNISFTATGGFSDLVRRIKIKTNGQYNSGQRP
ncbi:hypothetical protein CEXT_767171 [Caerostris extrusa]|uniref:Uncharacterized protein n=1 Tax=Caerostris extrusa TaxID=172846 RepID=A0AAV4P4A3_CAEEX|nr:hypothetical protein CEXT_767171 [Caerostris extrusa]